MKHQIEYTVSQFKDISDFKVALPCVHHLWDINDEAELLDDVKADLFHSLTSKLLYITKSTISDIEPDVAFFLKLPIYCWHSYKLLIWEPRYRDLTQETPRVVVTAVVWYYHCPKFGGYSLPKEKSLLTKIHIPFEVLIFLRLAFDQFLVQLFSSKNTTTAQQQRHVPDWWISTKKTPTLIRWSII